MVYTHFSIISNNADKKPLPSNRFPQAKRPGERQKEVKGQLHAISQWQTTHFSDHRPSRAVRGGEPEPAPELAGEAAS